MNVRHIALIALSSFAVASGAALADDAKVITSRSVTGFPGASYTGPGLPDSVVQFDRVVRTHSATFAAFGRDGYVPADAVTRPVRADLATEGRVGRDIPATQARVSAPTTATPASTDKTGRS
jgi:hypothetical protein